MSPKVLALLEMLLVLGAALGFAVWELISVRRELARDKEKRLGDKAP